MDVLAGLPRPGDEAHAMILDDRRIRVLLCGQQVLAVIAQSVAFGHPDIIIVVQGRCQVVTPKPRRRTNRTKRAPSVSPIMRCYCTVKLKLPIVLCPSSVETAVQVTV